MKLSLHFLAISIVCSLILTTTGCASVTVPLGRDARYGSLSLSCAYYPPQMP